MQDEQTLCVVCWERPRCAGPLHLGLASRVLHFMLHLRRWCAHILAMACSWAHDAQADGVPALRPHVHLQDVQRAGHGGQQYLPCLQVLPEAVFAGFLQLTQLQCALWISLLGSLEF